MAEPMVILGLDPGIATTGFGILLKDGGRLEAVEYGVITTPAGQAPPERLFRIHAAILELMERHHPDALATERLFFGRNETTAIGVGRTLGVALLAAAQSGIDWAEYPPAQVKQAVVGYGSADKKQVQYMIQRILNLASPPRPDDAADALAIAICHAHSAGLARPADP